NAYKEAGDAKKAIELYISALSINSNKEIVKLNQRTAKENILAILLAPVELYAANGMYNEASLKLNTLIDDNKITINSIPKNLDFLLDSKRLFFKRINLFRNNWGTISLYILFLFFLIYLLLHFIRTIRQPFLFIEDFDDSGVDTKGMSAFAAMMRTRLFRLSETSQSGNKIEQINASIAKFNIPAEIQAAVPVKLSWVKIIPWLLSLIFKRDIVQLTGYLHKPGKRGPGVTLQLAKNKHIIKSETLWQEDFTGRQSVDKDEQIATYYRLSDYGTIWLLFNLPQLFLSKKKKLLGTDRWYTYALFRAAYHAEKDHNPDAAKLLYLEAISLDPKFYAAYVNLAVLENKDYSDIAIELVKFVVKELTNEKNIKVSGMLDPTLYIAWKNLVVWTYEKDDNSSLDIAKKDVDDLLAHMDKCFHIFNKIKKYTLLESERNNDIKAYFKRIKPQIEAISIGLQIEQGYISEGIKQLKKLDKAEGDKFIYGVRYNLACTYTILATKCDNQEDLNIQEKYLEIALEHLKHAFWLGDQIYKAKEDKSLKMLREHKSTKKKFQDIIKPFEDKSGRKNLTDSDPL
ncbi:MAG: hypothetical protein ACC657_16170, partial [Thiohalomonadales bacterium]